MNRTALHLAMAASLSFTLCSASAESYTFTDLGTLGGNHSHANAINKYGQVVGYSYIAGNSTYHATLWRNSLKTDLGTLSGGTYSSASSINDAGQIVGTSNVLNAQGYPFAYNSTYWYGTTKKAIDTSNGNASAINNSGVVAGSADFGYAPAQAAIWANGSRTFLGTLGGTYSFATAINDVGQVVGQANLAGNNFQHAVLWSGTTKKDLGTLGGGYSQANAINNSGQVVGWSDITGGAAKHATFWNAGGIVDLGSLGGYSEANAINASGKIVGYAWTTVNGKSVQHATLWRDGTIVDLNSLLDGGTLGAGWLLSNAIDINDDGWIAGDAYNTITGSTHAFLLAVSAVPEPESYAMLFCGLGLLMLMTRSKKISAA